MSSRLARTAALAALATVLMAAAAHASTPSAYVYATSWQQTVRQYAADDAGALAPLVPAQVDAQSTSKGAVAAPDGRFLYVSNESSNDISQYAIAADGTLTPLAPATVAAGNMPFGLAVSPGGEHVYVANQDDNTIGVYDVGAGGTLTLASSAAAETRPVQVALSPDGNSAYATNATSDSVSQYDVGADGSLSPKTPASVPAGPTPVGIAVSPDGANAYVADQVVSGSIAQFSIGADGALSPLDPALVATGSQPEGVVAGNAGVYVANLGADTISQYDAGPGGALAPKAAGPIASADSPFGLAIAPGGGSLYVAAFGAAAVAQYDIGSDGALSAKMPASVGSDRRPMAVVAVKPRDEQAPTIDLRTPPDGAQYAFGEEVAVDYSCADEGGSGLASCTGAGGVRDGDPLDTATSGSHDFTVVARDGDGHQTTVTHHYTVAAAPDEQAPTVDLRAPLQGAQYDVGDDVRADYSCADEGGSGLASCTGDVPDGEPLDTTTPGTYDFTVVARDGAGHETTVTNSYTVVEPPPPPPGLDFQGFFGPIHDGSIVHAGDAIPIVFALDSYQGLDVLADGSPSSVQVDCGHPGEPTGGETARSQSGRGLRFSRRTGHYVFKWQTRSGWAGTCRTFILGLRDGSVERLTVSFRQTWYRPRHW
jgi:DNA-binding beta-propeller fold protein YncE